MKERGFIYPSWFVNEVVEAFPDNSTVLSLMHHGSVFSIEHFLRINGRDDLLKKHQTIWEDRSRGISSFIESFLSE